ncbi:FAD-dependent monooxygenase [Kitasatospora sp. NBC_01250]|uniref:FAD-dependent monooxygenase n=1 Tax=Kitasatospora sp. NBC_01250 TaxID=2903571 RepID=UPI002E2FFC3E|nr:FAD-dependent monooxygenase [Kitasatospora sp. NBC_01250]
MTSVLIVGAGPTGLTLACDLARRGIAVRIIEKSPEHPRSSRAKGPNPRSLEVLADLGVVDEVLAAGTAPLTMRKYRHGQPVADAQPFLGSRPTPDAPYDRPWLLPQWRLEEILRSRLADHGVRVELGTELVRFTQDASGVTAVLADGRQIDARYLVGCDGAHSTTRKLLGVPLAGRTAEELVMVCGDVELDGPDRGYWHQWLDEDGGVMLCPIPGTRAGWWFQASPERDAQGEPLAPSRDGFQRLLDRHARIPGLRLADATLLSTYRVNVRMVDRFRVGRVLLAGDSVHVHPVAGGLGMNTGIQDAFNLGWKLALVLTGQAGPGLLDTYEEERLPIAAWTLDITSERLQATLEAIKEPGGGLDSVFTPETNTLGLGYRWSSLAVGREKPDAPDGQSGQSGHDEQDAHDARLQPGDRAPDAPCRDAATGAPVRLFELFAGPHFTLLGFGPGAARALRETAAEHGSDSLRAYQVADGPHGPAGQVLDEHGLARSAYGITEDALVLVRPDSHVALIAPAGDTRAAADYLDRLKRLGA